jgi:hypothetical protein
MKYLLVWADYMSTGLRDEFSGPIEPMTLGLDEALARRMSEWVARYERITPLDESERALRRDEINKLDEEGINFANEVRNALGNEAKISYFSEGLLKKLT